MSLTKSQIKHAKIARKAADETATKMTREALEEAIARISADLKGPGIDFSERLCLNEERHAFRDALADLKDAQP